MQEEWSYESCTWALLTQYSCHNPSEGIRGIKQMESQGRGKETPEIFPKERKNPKKMRNGEMSDFLGVWSSLHGLKQLILSMCKISV